jgi:phosphonate transport system substrate-binding protein
VLAQEVEFVFTNHLFSPEREQLGWKVFGRRLTPPVHGQILVPADSPITDLAQLQGKEIAFPGPEALVAYKFPSAQLIARKVEARTVFGGNMDGALAQMFSGKVAAVGANSQLAEGLCAARKQAVPRSCGRRRHCTTWR